MPHSLAKVLLWTAEGTMQPSGVLDLGRASPEQNDVKELVTLLRACARNKDLRTGARIHRYLENNNSLLWKCSNALVTMYANCGACAKAKKYLRTLKIRDVFTWTSLIAAYAQNGQCSDAYALFEQMQHANVTPDAITYTCVLKVCGYIGAADKGKRIHEELISRDFLGSNTVVSNALVSMYIKCGKLDVAQQVFWDLPKKTTISWNILIAGFIQHAKIKEALDCLERMQRESCYPDGATFTCILAACGGVKDVHRGKQIHEEIAKQGLLQKDIILANALVAMYAKCGDLAKARQVLEEIPFPDVISWSALIEGYNQSGKHEQAFTCFEDMQRECIIPNSVTFICVLKACGSMRRFDKGKQIHEEIVKLGLLKDDIVLGTAVLDMYVKCGALNKAQEVLQELPTRNVVSWTAIIAGYAEHGDDHQALNCYIKMQDEGFPPNAVTLTCILKACGHLAVSDIGEEIHKEIAMKGLLREDAILANALLHMYTKFGALAKARQVLEELPTRNVLCWNSLISGFVDRGEHLLALNCFEEMKVEGVCPNTGTFLSILKACGSLGQVDRVERVQKEIVDERLLGNSTVIGNALMDVYTKCHAFAKAQQIFRELPIRNVISWSAMIDGYTKHGEEEHALDCFECMQQEGFYPDTVTFISILKACGSLGAAELGQMIHDEIARQELVKHNVVLGTALVDMYAKCAALDKAQQVLGELSIRDTGCWNALIGGYVRQGNYMQAISSYSLLLCEGLSPDAITILAVYKACSCLCLTEDAQKFLDIMCATIATRQKSWHTSYVFPHMDAQDNQTRP